MNLRCECGGEQFKAPKVTLVLYTSRNEAEREAESILVASQNYQDAFGEVDR